MNTKSGKLGVARQALDQFLTAMNTPVGQSVAGSLAGGAVGAIGSEVFNSVSPVDLDPGVVTGAAGAMGAMIGPQLLQKAMARANKNKYGTQLSLM